jgi:hypothetical protein
MSKSFIITAFMVAWVSTATAQDQIPQLNRRILDYVNTTIGTQVNRGECWDLAYEALERNNARWDGKYNYCNRYNAKKETVFPGDIIQFEKVKLRYTEGRITYTEVMKQHTAVVYSIIDQENKIFELAHQNTDFSGRKVGLSEFNLNHVTSGKVIFYRPVQASD